MIIAMMAAAYAQVAGGATPEANGQLFDPSIDSKSMLWTDDSGGAPSGQVSARMLLHYAADPVVYVDRNDEVIEVLSDILQLSAMFGATLGPVRIGLDAPVYLRSGGTEGGETGLGDIGVDGRVMLLDRTEKALGLALAARLTLPTTTVNAPLGNGGLGWSAKIIADKEFGKVHLAANLGTKGIPKVEFENFTWDDQFSARLGAGYALSEKAGLSLDFGSQLNYAGIEPGATPLEGILGGWGRAGNFMLRAGVGAGITNGFGAPAYRLIGGIGYEPPRDGDSDADGIVDSLDKCPERQEDLDGFEDRDGCPEPTKVYVVLIDENGRQVPGNFSVDRSPPVNGQSGGMVPLDQGSYTFSGVAPGYGPGKVASAVPGGKDFRVEIPVKKDAIPTTLEVAILDGAGQRIPGASWDVRDEGLLSQPTELPIDVPPGRYQVRAIASGYRPQTKGVVLAEGGKEMLTFTLLPARAEIVADRIDIRDSVYFETAKAIIKSESYGLLDEVAEILRDHPELTQIRIEGHTDVRGSDSYNLDLSKRRAAAVLEYLVRTGVSRDRLSSQGYGESKPIDPRNVEEAWKKNRRVDFFVTGRSD